MYSTADVELVQRLQRLVDEGIPISEATRLVSQVPAGHSLSSPQQATIPESAIDQLEEALMRFDGVVAHELLDDMLARFSTSLVLRDIIVPLLARIGEGYLAGTLAIAHEHYATSLLRGRVWMLVRNWEQGLGARAVLAAGAGDQHDLGLLVFGVALRERGWRITWIGTDTPAAEVGVAVDAIEARAAVVSMTRAEPAPEEIEALRRVADRCLLAVAGNAATPAIAQQCNAVLLDRDPVASASLDCFAAP
jgi:methanogenic corrinoid protein MtbC1